VLAVSHRRDVRLELTEREDDMNDVGSASAKKDLCQISACESCGMRINRRKG
jgi:hypothetical protein